MLNFDKYEDKSNRTYKSSFSVQLNFYANLGATYFSLVKKAFFRCKKHGQMFFQFVGSGNKRDHSLQTDLFFSTLSCNHFWIYGLPRQKRTN